MFNPWVRKIPWRRTWQPTPVFLPGEFHGQRSMQGYSLYNSIITDSPISRLMPDTGRHLKVIAKGSLSF